MPINTTQTTDASPALASEDVSTPKTLKRKSGRKKTSAAASAARPAATPAGPKAAAGEIIFRELPNPYHTPVPPYIWIDHPQQQERLQAPVYAVRLGVGGAQQVDISLDGGSWIKCRLTSGYWWYDWSAIAPGKHTLVARMRSTDGRLFRTPPRSCEYRP